MPKRRTILLILAFLLSLFAAGCGSRENAQPTNFVPYSNGELGLTLSYPEGWIVDNPIGGLTIASSRQAIDGSSLADIGDSGFVLIIPGEVAVLNFQTNQEFSQDNVIEALGVYRQLLEREGQEFTVVEPPSEFETNGQKGARTLLRTQEDGKPVMTLLAVLINKDYMALISAASQETAWSANRPALEQIIDTVQVSAPDNVSSDS